MLIYDQLPVFKACYDLLLDVFLTTKNLNKEYKYTLGEDLKKEVIALLMGIYKANSYQDKRNMLQQARDRVEVIRLYIRLLYDLKQITLKRFVALNAKVEPVSKQLSGWHKTALSNAKNRNTQGKGSASHTATADASVPD